MGIAVKCMKAGLERGEWGPRERVHTGLAQICSRFEATGDRPEIFVSGRKSDDSKE